MTMYIVDEDEIQMKPLRLELSLRDISVEQMLSADDMIRRMSTFNSDDYFLIDVMLAVDTDERNSAFSRAETDDYKITGLRLVERLLNDRKDIPPSHIVLMSQAASKPMKDQIKSFAQRHRVRFVAKSAYDDPMSFGNEVEATIKTTK